jgi:hypothetical protein
MGWGVRKVLAWWKGLIFLAAYRLGKCGVVNKLAVLEVFR